LFSFPAVQFCLEDDEGDNEEGENGGAGVETLTAAELLEMVAEHLHLVPATAADALALWLASPLLGAVFYILRNKKTKSIIFNKNKIINDII
jgi:hypothetical protein